MKIQEIMIVIVKTFHCILKVCLLEKTKFFFNMDFLVLGIINEGYVPQPNVIKLSGNNCN